MNDPKFVHGDLVIHKTSPVKGVGQITTTYSKGGRIYYRVEFHRCIGVFCEEELAKSKFEDKENCDENV